MDPVALALLLTDPQYFRAETGFAYRGLTFSERRDGDGWNVVIRVWSGGIACYAMYTGESLGDSVSDLLRVLRSRDGHSVLRRDRFYGK